MGAVETEPAPSHVSAFGAWLLLLGAILGTLTVFSALVPWEIGVWPRFEAGGMALYFAAGICGSALTVLWFQDRPNVEAALGHPLVLSALFVTVLSAFFAFFVEYPWLSVFGYPLIGEGALRYAAIAVLFAAANVLRRDVVLFRIFLVFLVFGSLGGTVALYFGVRGTFVSLDMTGILVVPAWLGAWFLMPPKWGIWRFSVCGLVVTPILFASTNDAAILAALAIGLPASILIYLNVRRQVFAERTARIFAGCAVAAIPFAALLAVWWTPVLTDALPSITSRKYMYQVLFAALHADPLILLAGQGWGEIVLTMDRFRTFSDAVMWDGSWDGATRDLPHAHSLVLEAAFGAGILAVLGVIALLVVPVFTCSQRDLPVAVFVVSVVASIAAIWPQPALTVAPVALALGLVCASRDSPQPLPVAGRMLGWALPVLAACLLGSSLWLALEGVGYQRALADIREKGRASVYACNLHPNSAMYGDLDLVQGLIKVYRPAFRRAKDGAPVSETDHRLIPAYLCSAEARVAKSASPSLHLGLESFRGQVSSDGGRTPDILRYRDSLAGWPDKLVGLLNVAPNRTDMTIGFFTTRVQAGAWGSVGSLARALLSLDPQDPVANWYLGQYLLSKGDSVSRDAGRKALQEALTYGIKRHLPISPDVEAVILQGRQSLGTQPAGAK